MGVSAVSWGIDSAYGIASAQFVATFDVRAIDAFETDIGTALNALKGAGLLEANKLRTMLLRVGDDARAAVRSNKTLAPYADRLYQTFKEFDGQELITLGVRTRGPFHIGYHLGFAYMRCSTMMVTGVGGKDTPDNLAAGKLWLDLIRKDNFPGFDEQHLPYDAQIDSILAEYKGVAQNGNPGLQTVASSIESLKEAIRSTLKKASG